MNVAFHICLLHFLKKVFIPSQISEFSWYYLPPASLHPFNIFCNSEFLLPINYLSFTLSQNIFVLLLFLKNIFTEYRIPGWQFFLFYYLNVGIPLSLASAILAEELGPFRLLFHHSFSLVAFTIFLPEL